MSARSIATMGLGVPLVALSIATLGLLGGASAAQPNSGPTSLIATSFQAQALDLELVATAETGSHVARVTLDAATTAAVVDTQSTSALVAVGQASSASVDESSCSAVERDRISDAQLEAAEAGAELSHGTATASTPSTTATVAS